MPPVVILKAEALNNRRMRNVDEHREEHNMDRSLEMNTAVTATDKAGMAAQSRDPVRYLVFSASLRSTSLNTQLAKIAAGAIEKHGGKVDLASMSDFDVPSYDQDTQDGDGFPP